jgi:hypothetical protein
MPDGLQADQRHLPRERLVSYTRAVIGDERQSVGVRLVDIPRVARCMLPTCPRGDLPFPADRGRPPLFCSEAHQALYRRVRERLTAQVDGLTRSLETMAPRGLKARETRAALALLRWHLVRYPRLQG